MYIYGVHPVSELLDIAPEQITTLYAASLDDSRLAELVERARTEGISCERVETGYLDQLCHGGNHQGVALQTRPFRYTELDAIIEATADKSRAMVLILDHIQDPGNLGAILRSAAAFGVDGVVLPKDRACGVTPTVIRRSAGLAYRIPVAMVTNLNRTLEALAEAGYWSVGCDASGDDDLWSIDLDMKTTLVIGSEHDGISRLVGENCDFIAQIPMAGDAESLNAAQAATVALYETRRQWSLD